jgi:chromosome partitioning protein
MPRTLAVVAQKGGVAKTTTVANLAAAYGVLRRRVLVIDLDPQFDLTRAFGQAPSQAPATVLQVLAGEESLDSATVQVADGVDLVPSHRDLRRLELTLVSEVQREQFLRSALQGATEAYDFVFVDCPPNLGLLTVNALFAAPEVIVPVSMRDSAALQSAGEVRATVRTLTERGVDVSIRALLRTMVDRRRLAYRSITATLSELGLPIARTEIPMLAAFDNSVVVGRPLVLLEPNGEGASAYRQLALELLESSAAVPLEAAG